MLRTLWGEHQPTEGPTTTLSKGGRQELKVDYVLDNWINYKLS